YTQQFGPYPYNHLSVVERPGSPGTGMHAEAGMITHGEGFTFYNPPNNPFSYDHPSAVVAHEMAHQWTVPYANVEGAPVMSESLAWYYAIKAVENTRGEHQLQRLFEFLRESHVRPEIRRGEPLLRGLDPYMSYRKGPFALYTLSKYLGEKQVNSALRQLLLKHRAEGTPLATTLDLYQELREVTPDSLRYLLHDLFEVNTHWMFDTKQATARQTAAGTWQVTFEMEAQKSVMDSAGVETTMPVNQWVEIGIFAAADPSEFLGKPLYMRKHFIRSGPQTITVTVPQKPARGGIDPYNLLDREEGGNIEEIQL
ncbi:MAG: hypothetical protein KKG00_10540, partial [Bacteroidetes bacterium]|nr:hypothetical protein [Bacteroidota bacterium]